MTRILVTHWLCHVTLKLFNFSLSGFVLGDGYNCWSNNPHKLLGAKAGGKGRSKEDAEKLDNRGGRMVRPGSMNYWAVAVAGTMSAGYIWYVAPQTHPQLLMIVCHKVEAAGCKTIICESYTFT
eukprot:2279769-Rhodomonas_salina.1